MIQVKSKVKKMELSARIIRADGSIQELGVISYWHTNFLKRILWRIKQWLRYLLTQVKRLLPTT